MKKLKFITIIATLFFIFSCSNWSKDSKLATQSSGVYPSPSALEFTSAGTKTFNIVNNSLLDAVVYAVINPTNISSDIKVNDVVAKQSTKQVTVTYSGTTSTTETLKIGFKLNSAIVNISVNIGSNFGSGSSNPINATPLQLSEALDNSTQTFVQSTDNNKGWIIDETNKKIGVSSARSGAIIHNQKSCIETTIKEPVDLSFYWKVSSEANDLFIFYLNGVEKSRLYDVIDWTQRTFYNVNSDSQLKWCYIKDNMDSLNDDSAWLDSVSTSPLAHSWVYSDWTTCNNSNQTRTVICQKTSDKTQVADSYCVAANKEALSQTCDMKTTYTWRTNNWGDCIKWNKTRNVYCEKNDVQNNIQTVDPGFCPSSTKPASSEFCEMTLTSATGLELSTALDTTLNFVQSANNNAGWVVNTADKKEGISSVNSGLITHNQKSCIEAPLVVDASDLIDLSFYWKVNSDPNDYLYFYINGAIKDKISGNQDWTKKTFSLNTGTNTLKWCYEKNDNDPNITSDMAWLDYVSVIDKLTNSIGMKFVWVKAGSFQMGGGASDIYAFTSDTDMIANERPVHTVNITKDFDIGKYEVTQGQWKSVMGSNPSNFSSCGDNCPVEKVSWNAIQSFITKLNEKEGTNKYRLPTEAEWEYAARAGTTTSSYNGDIVIVGENNAPLLDAIAWYGGNSGVSYLSNGDCNNREMQYPVSTCGTNQVGKKQPNAWGIYDMLGNVMEFVKDNCTYTSGTFTDPECVGDTMVPIIRGGGWSSIAVYSRISFRNKYDKISYNTAVGFRVARYH